jgi:threonine dehydrogenase-like Zn-dependent dehydrogenase
MKATYVVFPELGKVAVASEELDTGNLGPNEVVMRNEATIISSGTELATLHSIEGTTSFPCRPGYGSIGVVESVGTAVKDFKPGDRAFYAGKHASAQRFTHNQDHQWGLLYPCPKGIDAVDATFACMAEIAMTAPNITELALGDTAAVFGLGLVGNLAAQLYQAAGARVIGVDPVKSRCELARRVGIETVVDAPADQQVAAVKSLTGGAGAAVTVDAVGHSAVIATAVQATALMGQVVLLGSPRAKFPSDLTPTMSDIHVRCLTLRGAHMWQFPAFAVRGAKKTVPWGYQTCFELIRSRRLKVRELASHVIKPADAPKAYHGLQHEKEAWTGVVIDWR